MNIDKAHHSRTILIVEPDHNYGQQLIELFWREGFVIKRCQSALQAENVYKNAIVDLMLVSNQLPEMKGFTFLKQCRQVSHIPIVLLADNYSDTECVNSFFHGADDYIPRKQPIKEVLCRVIAILRRIQQRQLPSNKTKLLIVDDLKMDKQSLAVSYKETTLSMTPIQFNLLWTLAFQQNQVLSKDYLYRQVLSREFSLYDRSLDMHLSRVRRKLVSAGMPVERLKTAHGVGYSFN
ncbi:winged helix-turn-helix domain-containing protein [Photobacterium leiognathi]|uniref:winged helix-turn-helix domain-containing protein n=1 Tax=Photobacterium leiognathi TaxID=553611 RepID=UPI003AF3C66B